MSGHRPPPGAPSPASPSTLDVAAALRGRSILITGATGFLGKVTLSLLLERYPDIGRVFVLVRPGMGGTAEDRFFGAVAAGRPFDPLRARHGDGFDAFLRARCVPLAGDVTAPGMGLSPEDLARLQGVDAVLNCAGLVDFSPSLEQALSVNVEGVRHAVDLARALGAGLLHVSTCYVAGGRDGVVEEDEPIVGYFPRAEGVEERPRQPTLPGPFSVAVETSDAAARIAEARAQADDAVQASGFLQAACERLRLEGRAGDEKARIACASELARQVGQQERRRLDAEIGAAGWGSRRWGRGRLSWTGGGPPLGWTLLRLIEDPWMRGVATLVLVAVPSVLAIFARGPARGAGILLLLVVAGLLLLPTGNVEPPGN